MSDDQSLPVGKFVWHDLMTTDVDKAIAFYTALLPWTVQDFALGGGMGNYHMILAAGAGEQGEGGFVPLDASYGQPSHWIGYVAVEDVDATVAAASPHGGQVGVSGTDIPDIGRFAVVVDPQGGFVSPFRPVRPSGEGRADRPPGTVAWNELLAPDPQGAAEFYGRLFGWTMKSMDMGEMGLYHMFARPNGKDAGGMLAKPPEAPGPALWVPYFEIEEIDGAVARVPDLGGQVFVAPRDTGAGRFAVLGDPTGATFALLQSPPKSA